MNRIGLAIVLVVSMLNPLAYAAKPLSEAEVYDSDGSIVVRNAYAVYGVQDTVGVAGVVAIALAESIENAAIATMAIGPTAVIAWGAMRTEALRPEETKKEIRVNIAKNERKPVPGSLQELLD